ncbi:MAG TPA: hypothetical protein VGC04_00945 [Cellulomonas sp.]
MLRQAFTAVASVSVLVAGVAVPADRQDAPAAAPASGAAVRVATAVAIAAADERTAMTGQIALADEAVHTLARRRAEAAAQVARAEALRVAAAKAAQDAAAAQAAAEAASRAAAEAASRSASAAAAAKSTGATKPKPAAPAKPRVSSPARPASSPGPAIAWHTTVVDTGGQDALDRCLGGLTRWFEDVDGKPYYPIHRGCGGTPILGLHLGDRVQIDSKTWVVTDARDLPKGSHYSAAAGMNGQILLQTCYRDPSVMRIVALTSA